MASADTMTVTGRSGGAVREHPLPNEKTLLEEREAFTLPH